MILVGDAPYYARFGFAPVPPGRLAPPCPVDPARFLWRELAPGVAGTSRGVRPWRRDPAEGAAARAGPHGMDETAMRHETVRRTGSRCTSRASAPGAPGVPPRLARILADLGAGDAAARRPLRADRAGPARLRRRRAGCGPGRRGRRLRARGRHAGPPRRPRDRAGGDRRARCRGLRGPGPRPGGARALRRPVLLRLPLSGHRPAPRRAREADRDLVPILPPAALRGRPGGRSREACRLYIGTSCGTGPAATRPPSTTCWRASSTPSGARQPPGRLQLVRQREGRTPRDDPGGGSEPEPIAVPTCIRWPEADPLFPYAWSDGLPAYFADLDLAPFPGVGHFRTGRRPTRPPPRSRASSSVCRGEAASGQPGRAALPRATSPARPPPRAARAHRPSARG